MLTLRSATFVIQGFLCALPGAAIAQDDDLFRSEIQPILARHCFACHGPDVAESGLSFADDSALTAETDSGEPAIVPGDANASELIRRVLSREDYEQMPPEGERLSDEQIELLKRWINSGAEFSTHWAFVPPSQPEPPAVQDEAWVCNDIDRFVLAKLEANDLRPAPEASKRELIRRLKQDLLGLPPSIEEVEAFATDESPDAYVRLIDRMLASPHYGERWGRHWLDIVRFAESNSFERDNPKPNAWKYRDYVIQSFNDDKPYDRFVMEQLAGDELDSPTAEMLTGTGYLRLGIWDDEPADPLLHRFEQFDDLVSTTGQSMLGLTVGCARCHDHKIDPISQKDYYSFVSFFAGMTEYARRGDQMNAEWSQIDISSVETLDEHARLDEALRAIDAKMYDVEQNGVARMTGPQQRQSEGPRRAKLLKEQLDKHLNEEELNEYKALKAERKKAEQSRGQLPKREFVLGVAKSNPNPPTTHVLQRGNPAAVGDAVQPTFLSVLGGGHPDELRSTEKSSGRRRALAEWIASEENGLTARVAVNRIWQHHFGRGIVRTPNNFGQLGVPPTHPELLDWLANEFANSGWSFKRIHRLILLSSTYRMSTAFDQKAAFLDPANNLLWRRDLRRMDAEEVRDAVLAVCGTLNTKIGGASVYPAIEEEVRQGLSRPDSGWPTTTGPEANRRSVYIFVKRSLVVPLLSAFDYPDPDSSCEARFKTTQPAQSLALLNSQFLREQSAALMTSLEAAGPMSNTEFATALFHKVLARDPSAAEQGSAVAFLADLEKLGDGESEDEIPPRQMLCLLVLNLNEFLYVP